MAEPKIHVTQKSSGPARALSPRQVQVLELICQGLPDKQIAAELGISYGTLRSHIGKLFQKLDAQSRAGLVYAFLSNRTATKSRTTDSLSSEQTDRS